MKLITFNPFRTIGIPGVQYVKPEKMFDERYKIKSANYLLFPEYWQVNSLVYGWKKKIFPSPATYHLGHNKIEMTRLFKAIVPDNVPHTIILANDEAGADKILANFNFPFVAKKVRSSEGRGVWLVKNKDELLAYLAQNDILYIQEYLPINRDLRVVYVGDKIITAYWRIGKGDFKNNVAQGGAISFKNIPDGALELVEKVAKTAGINHAGFDVAVVDNKYFLLEFNVLFGNQGLKNKNNELNQYIYQYILQDDDFHQPPGRKRAI